MQERKRKGKKKLEGGYRGKKGRREVGGRKFVGVLVLP